MDTVALDTSTLVLCDGFARQIHTKKGKGRTHDGDGSSARNIIGKRGEGAFASIFARHTGVILPIDLRLRRLGQGDNGVDFVLPVLCGLPGVTVDVKTRGQEYWDFATDTEDGRDFKADIGVLAWPADRRGYSISLVGWVTRESFFGEEKKLRRVNYTGRSDGWRLARTWDSMEDMAAFWRLVRG